MAKLGDRKTVSWLFRQSKAQHLKILFIIAGNIIFAATGTVFALMCRGIVDGAVSKNKNEIILFSAMLLGVILLQLVLRLSVNSVTENAASRLAIDIRSDLYSSLLKKDFSKVGKYHSGELLNRMFSDVKIITDGVITILPNLLNMITKIICAGTVLVFLDKSFAVIFVCAGLVMFFVTRFFRKKIKRLHKEVQEKEGVVRSFLQETTENLLVMKAFGCENKVKKINSDNQNSHFKAQMKRRTVSIIASAGFGFVFQLGYLYAMIWGARSIFLGVMSYGTLTAILQLVGQIQTPFANLSSVFPKLYGMLASAERVMEIEAVEDEKASDKKLSYGDFCEIEISDMSFSYGENHVLNNVDIKINKGDFTALTGISGGGKSTLFLLLMGAYMPDCGKISFLSQNGGVYSAGSETRKLFAYVPQGNFLFSGTVYENLTFLNENASAEEVENACKTACALEFINEFPDGFETRIGENGFGISEGQAQRIAIARALLSNREILLFDEATSALDESCEARLLENISKLNNKTLLIVTHRPKALEICNKKLILKNGNLDYEHK